MSYPKHIGRDDGGKCIALLLPKSKRGIVVFENGLYFRRNKQKHILVKGKEIVRRNYSNIPAECLPCMGFMKNYILLFAIAFALPALLPAQHNHMDMHNNTTLVAAEPQPLLAQVLRLNDALTFLGSPLSQADAKQLKQLTDEKPGPNTAKSIQQVLDPYCIAVVTINAEERVSVLAGTAAPKLVQNGWTTFLVKVINQAGVTAPLQVQSPNAAPLLHGSGNGQHASIEHLLMPGQVAGRFVELAMYRNRPLLPNLSGLGLEYAVLQVYCKDRGQREIELGFNVGQGSQDIGFRNAIHVLFYVRPAVKVKLQVQDDDGSPAMASFTITDGIERILPDSIPDLSKTDYHVTLAENEYGVLSKQLKGIYPLPSRRMAEYDEYPDFFFEPQVYRTSGEYIELPPGRYTVKVTRGPEYLTQQSVLVVPEGVDTMHASFRLKRWINMAKFGWYSGDHHVHAAGCSHYESPQEGVKPADMLRQVQGEDLNVAALLSWGPGWYYQKNFFTGAVNPLSTQNNIIRYDVEVSGFPSSHAGHLDLLGLSEDDYPGTTKIEQWPSWTLPVLQWAKKQGGITGYAHSGWGLQPKEPNTKLPNYDMPEMSGIGANEYVVTVTQHVVDIYSAGDTPAPWELNMWYHTLNCGFRTSLSGETDFPCIFDERVGIARSYFKTDSTLNYDTFLQAIKKGRNYVSDGRSHIIDFSVGGLEMGTHNSELPLNAAKTVNITARVAAYLPATQDEQGAAIAHRSAFESPYWHLERARISSSRKVAVELIVNGEVADTQQIAADGNWNEVHFTYPVKQSSWIALRIYQSSHTNPVFVLLNNKNINIKQSAEWCRQAVDVCWKMKQPNIRAEEQPAAKAAYDDARRIYDQLIKEAE